MDESGHLAAECGVEQHPGPDEIGLEEGGRAHDGAIDVALGGEMDHDVVTGHHLAHELRITDVTFHEDVARVLVELGHRGRDAGIGEGIEVGHRRVRLVREDDDG